MRDVIRLIYVDSGSWLYMTYNCMIPRGMYFNQNIQFSTSFLVTEKKGFQKRLSSRESMTKLVVTRTNKSISYRYLLEEPYVSDSYP